MSKTRWWQAIAPRAMEAVAEASMGMVSPYLEGHQHVLGWLLSVRLRALSERKRIAHTFCDGSRFDLKPPAFSEARNDFCRVVFCFLECFRPVS